MDLCCTISSSLLCYEDHIQYVKIEDGGLFIFILFSYFELRVMIRVILYMTVTNCHISITSHGYMIIYLYIKMIIRKAAVEK